jgi:hypothetical protein
MRVTIDCDYHSDAVPMLCKALREPKLKRFPDEIRESASRKGYHFIWRGVGCSWEECLAIRRRIGDDPMRIRIDRACADKPRQILWSSKRKKDGLHKVRKIGLKVFMKRVNRL